MNLARAAHREEGILVSRAERAVIGVGGERGHGFVEAQPDDLLADRARGQVEPVRGEGGTERAVDGRAAVDQRAVAVEDREPVHGRRGGRAGAAGWRLAGLAAGLAPGRAAGLALATGLPLSGFLPL